MIHHILVWTLTLCTVLGCWIFVYWPIRPTYRDRKPWNVD